MLLMPLSSLIMLTEEVNTIGGGLQPPLRSYAVGAYSIPSAVLFCFHSPHPLWSMVRICSGWEQQSFTVTQEVSQVSALEQVFSMR
jgi:hypothetical protein